MTLTLIPSPPSVADPESGAANVVEIKCDTIAMHTVEASPYCERQPRVCVDLDHEATGLFVQIAGDAFLETSTGMRDGLETANISTEHPEHLRQIGEAMIAAAMRAEACGMFQQLKANQAARQYEKGTVPRSATAEVAAGFITAKMEQDVEGFVQLTIAPNKFVGPDGVYDRPFAFAVHNPADVRALALALVDAADAGIRPLERSE